MSEMIKSAIQVKREQHKQEMDEMLAQQREAITAAITAQVAAQMAAYEAQIRVLERFRHVSSTPEVTNDRAFPAHVIIRFSIDSRSCNNILFLFLI